MEIEKYLNKEEIDDICVDVESFIFLRIKEDLNFYEIMGGKYDHEFVSELVNDILRKMYFLE